MFIKLVTKAESQQMWLPIIVGWNPKYFCPPKCMWSKLSPLFYGKYLYCLISRERYDVRLKEGQIGNHPWLFDRHYNTVWPWMTLKCSGSRSLKLHVKYVANGTLLSAKLSVVGSYRTWPLSTGPRLRTTFGNFWLCMAHKRPRCTSGINLTPHLSFL